MVELGRKIAAVFLVACMASGFFMLMAGPGRSSGTTSAVTIDMRTDDRMFSGEAFLGVKAPFYAVYDNTLASDHAPIAIEGDAEFTAQASAESWAGNGTAGNPFVIQNYSFVLDNLEVGVHIGNVSVSFMIKNCTFVSADIDKPASKGIWMQGVHGATVIGDMFNGTGCGLALVESTSINVNASEFRNCPFMSIWLIDCNDVHVGGSIMAGSSFGVVTEGTSDLTVLSNHFQDIEFCALLNNDELSGLVINNNICISASLLISYDNATLASMQQQGNTVNGRPFLLLRNMDLLGQNLTDDAGQLVLFNVTNGRIEGRMFDHQAYAIMLSDCHGMQVLNNTVNVEKLGIVLTDCSDITVSGNRATNAHYGAAVYLFESNACIVQNNECTFMMAGIIVQASPGCVLTSNKVGGCIQGLLLDQCDGNSITANIFARSVVQDINVTGSHNRIYLNTFIIDETMVSGNWTKSSYDAGEGNDWSLIVEGRAVGNYWSAYQGASKEGVMTGPLAIDGPAMSSDPYALVAAPRSVSQPTGLHVTWDGQVPTLHWNRTQADPASVVGQFVVVRGQGNGAAEVVGIIPYSSGNFTDAPLEKGTTYTYSVTVMGVDGSSAASRSLEVSHGVRAEISTELALILIVIVVMVGMVVSLYLASENRKSRK